MAGKKKKIKRKVRITQKARLIHKSDATRVAKPQTLDTIPKAPTQMPRDNGLNMRVKIRRKTK